MHLISVGEELGDTAGFLLCVCPCAYVCARVFILHSIKSTVTAADVRDKGLHSFDDLEKISLFESSFNCNCHLLYTLFQTAAFCYCWAMQKVGGRG